MEIDKELLCAVVIGTLSVGESKVHPSEYMSLEARIFYNYGCAHRAAVKLVEASK